MNLARLLLRQIYLLLAHNNISLRGKVKLMESRKKIETEFLRIAQQMVSQGDVDVICDLITTARKREFIKSWHEGG